MTLELYEIPQKIFFPYRLLMMHLLRDRKSVNGKQLRDELKITDGFLWSHIRALESEGLIIIEKKIEGRKVYTKYSITEKGIRVYEDFRESMMEFLKN